jgi:hypothetical protein
VELGILGLPCENCTFVEECPFWGPVVMLLLWDLGAAPYCLTNAGSAYTITLALSKRQVAAVTPGPVASSQTNVREQSRVGYYNGNIITLFGV